MNEQPETSPTNNEPLTPGSRLLDLPVEQCRQISLQRGQQMSDALQATLDEMYRPETGPSPKQ